MLFSRPAGLMARTSQRPKADSKVIAISSPHGSTGKTTVAINLALELASEKFEVLLIDGDLKGPSIANHFMLSELPAGLPGGLRIAGQQRLDAMQLERLSIQIPKTTLRIMPGSQAPTIKPIQPQSFSSLVDAARENFDFTVIDLSSLEIPSASIALAEDDDQGFTAQMLRLSDAQIVVCLADPIGIFRLLAQEKRLLEVASSPLLVMNRVRNQVIAQAKSEIGITLQRLSEFDVAAYLPDDQQQIDQALKTGVPAVSLSRSGAFRQAITGFARAEILGTKGKLDSRVAKLG